MDVDGVNLEEAPTSVEAGAPPVQQPAVSPPVQEPEEPEVAEVGGRTMVPVEALRQAREEARAAKQLRVEVEALKGQAKSGEELQRWVDTVRPLLAKLNERPDVVQAIMAGKDVPAAGAKPANAIPDDRAAKYARRWELFTSAGELDVARAKDILIDQDTEARRVAEEAARAAVGPIQERMARGTAQQVMQQYLGVKDKAGKAVNAAVLQQVWSALPPQMAEDQNASAWAYYAAKGYAAHHGLDAPEPPGAAVVTESPGGGAPAAKPMGDVERAIARVLDIDEKRWADRAAKYKPGAINVLE